MKKRLLVLFLIAVVAGLSFAQQKHALVIGNGAYKNVTKLNNPVNDANDMAAALQGLGFTVDKVLNGTQDQMVNAVMELKRKLSASRNSYGFLFYAGHGVQSNGENFLIPVDANIPSESFLRNRTVSVQEMLDELNNAGNEFNMVVLDACRDNPFSWKRSGSRGLSMVGQQPADSILVYSTSAGSTAADGTGRNGLFTSHLLNNLKTPGLEITEVLRRTGADVAQASGNQQRPAVYNQFYGTVYLAGKPQATTTVTPQPAPAVQPTPQPAPAPTPQPAAVQPVSVPAGMVLIQGGTFKMGSPANEPNRGINEVQHQVTLGGFYMGKYEVTQKEYKEVMGTNPSEFKGDNVFKADDFPVENVSWYDAIEYCNKRSQKEGLIPAYTIDKNQKDPNNKNSADNLKWTVTWNKNANGYRLPTEAEWEYACRAGTATPYNTGINISQNMTNFNGYYGRVTEVGSFSPNAWGLFDMHGNVNEWCWDWFGNYSSGSQTDPIGASSGVVGRVVRGGSWKYGANEVRSAYRSNYDPDKRGNNLGFRIVRS